MKLIIDLSLDLFGNESECYLWIMEGVLPLEELLNQNRNVGKENKWD